MVQGTDEAAEEFLRARGAGTIPHPGGTLLAHLRRVADLLAAWGARPALTLAGLCHAVYGTDGFPTTLVGLDGRPQVAELVGAEAEALIYLYASCGRSATYPRLTAEPPVMFTDRFTGSARPVGEPQLRDFLEVTAANELDICARSPGFAAEAGPSLLALFSDTCHLLSAPAWEHCLAVLGSPP